VPRYDYRCQLCGPFTRIRSIAEDTARSACPDCDGPAIRQFSVPTLIDRTSPVRRAMASSEASSSEPAVVRRTASTQAGQATPARLPGRLAGLPRP
jgi:putative FmdB family regulatory protein